MTSHNCVTSLVKVYFNGTWSQQTSPPISLHDPSRNDLKNKFDILQKFLNVINNKILTSVWALHTLNAGGDMLFQCFFFRKARQSKKIDAKFSKNMDFFNLYQNAGWRFYLQKTLKMGAVWTQKLVKLSPKTNLDISPESRARPRATQQGCAK